MCGTNGGRDVEWEIELFCSLEFLISDADQDSENNF